jgi:hypothetical protein
MGKTWGLWKVYKRAIYSYNYLVTFFTESINQIRNIFKNGGGYSSLSSYSQEANQILRRYRW